MRAFLLATLAFIAGFVLAWLGAMCVYIVGIETGFLHDRDGGPAMGFAFVIGPFFGLILGTIAAIVVARRVMRSGREPLRSKML